LVWLTLPSSTWPRISTTSNQVTFSIVAGACATALLIASEMLFGEVPTSSSFL
jgi:hypothetical protein